MVSKHLFNGLAFCSLLHPRVPRNLGARPPRALRSVSLDSGTLDTAYLNGLVEEIDAVFRTGSL